MTGALSTAVIELSSNCHRTVPSLSKPILCEVGPFCERRNRRSQLGAKVENPQPPHLQQSVRFGGTWGGTKFFWGGGLRCLAKNCSGRFWDLEGVSETFSKNYLPPPRSTRTLHFAPKIVKLDSCGFGGRGAQWSVREHMRPNGKRTG